MRKKWSLLWWGGFLSALRLCALLSILQLCLTISLIKWNRHWFLSILKILFGQPGLIMNLWIVSPILKGFNVTSIWSRFVSKAMRLSLTWLRLVRSPMASLLSKRKWPFRRLFIPSFRNWLNSGCFFYYFGIVMADTTTATLFLALSWNEPWSIHIILKSLFQSRLLSSVCRPHAEAVCCRAHLAILLRINPLCLDKGCKNLCAWVRNGIK